MRRNNRSIVGKDPILLMLCKSKKSAFGVGGGSQIITHLLHLKILKKRRKRVSLKSMHHPILRG